MNANEAKEKRRELQAEMAQLTDLPRHFDQLERATRVERLRKIVDDAFAAGHRWWN